MRIITGKHRAKKIYTYKEKDLRPTSNRIKETIFNILNHADQEYVKNGLSDYNCFLDIFCGTSGMSFEALSRGVKSVMLVDSNPDLIEMAQYNAKEFGEEENVKTIRADATRLPKSFSQSELCFIDPPYNRNLISKTLTSLDKQNWLSNGAVVIIESDKKEAIVFPQNYKVFNERLAGKTRLTFCSYNRE